MFEELAKTGEVSAVEGLVPQWRTKERLLKDSDAFVGQHIIEVRDRILGSKLENKRENAEELARIALAAVFMIQEMRRVSPISLIKPVEVVEEFDPVEGEGWFATDEMGDRYIFVVYYDSLKKLVRSGESELGVLAMMSGVHEFAHMVYRQEAGRGQNQRLKFGVKESLVQARWGRLATWESSDESYASLDMEIRARMWQRSFLKQYFPESKHLVMTRKEIAYGRHVRKKREFEIEKFERWKTNQRKEVGA